MVRIVRMMIARTGVALVFAEEKGFEPLVPLQALLISSQPP